MCAPRCGELPMQVHLNSSTCAGTKLCHLTAAAAGACPRPQWARARNRLCSAGVMARANDAQGRSRYGVVLGRSRSRKRDGTYEATYTDLWPAIDQGAATLQPSIASRRHWDAKLSKALQPESDSGRAPSAARSLWGSSIALGGPGGAAATLRVAGHTIQEMHTKRGGRDQQQAPRGTAWAVGRRRDRTGRTAGAPGSGCRLRTRRTRERRPAPRRRASWPRHQSQGSPRGS